LETPTSVGLGFQFALESAELLRQKDDLQIFFVGGRVYGGEEKYHQAQPERADPMRPLKDEVK
jgi:hypothetical protein